MERIISLLKYNNTPQNNGNESFDKIEGRPAMKSQS
jgi:hypothetical protein